jgi:hypothetical protein
VACVFKTGCSTLKSLKDLVDLLNLELAKPKAEGDRLHSITARKLTLGYPVSLKHKLKLVNICQLISYTIFTLFCTNFYQSSGGTFAERKYETLNPPKSQKFNSFMVTKQSQMERAVYSRFIAHALFQLLLFTIWLQNYISTHMRI